MDAQSRAFREASPADRVKDHHLEDHAERAHEPLTDLADIKLPDWYEQEIDGWDVERVGPKTPAEAREALAERIADPTAPDGAEVSDAYGDDD